MLETLGHEPLRVNMNNLLIKYNPALVRQLRARGDIGPNEGVEADLAEELETDERGEAASSVERG